LCSNNLAREVIPEPVKNASLQAIRQQISDAVIILLIKQKTESGSNLSRLQK
jgi:hypothetical protein